MEQSKGIDGNNVVSVLMNENGFSLQEAADFIGDRCSEFASTYVSAKERLSLSHNSDAVRFINALGSWMIGNVSYVKDTSWQYSKPDDFSLVVGRWSFDSLRYFGTRHLEVKETRVVTLRPKEITDTFLSEW